MKDKDLKKKIPIKYLKDCVDTRWVSSSGGWVKKFEEGIYAVDKDGEKKGTLPVKTEVLQTVYSNYSN